MKSIFDLPFKDWSPEEVRKIRQSLNKTTAQFAEMFIVSEDLIKAWEAPRTSKRHRDVYGPESVLMREAEAMVEGKTVCRIRLAVQGRLKVA